MEAEGDAPAAQAQRLHLGSFFVAGVEDRRGEKKPCAQAEKILAFFQLLWHCMACACSFPWTRHAPALSTQ